MKQAVPVFVGGLFVLCTTSTYCEITVCTPITSLPATITELLADPVFRLPEP